MPNTSKDGPILSICLTCRDGREHDRRDVRGGMRLAEAVLQRIVETGEVAFDLRGVACMSQCKRSCVASLGANGRFSYIFGELDPEKICHANALIELPRLYLAAPEGFLDRLERPEALRANILGRLPPMCSTSSLVTPLAQATAA